MQQFEHTAQMDRPIEATHVALHSAQDLARRVQRLVEYMIGPIPARDEGDQIGNGMGSVLERLNAHACRASRDIEDAHSEINRLEKMLPEISLKEVSVEGSLQATRVMAQEEASHGVGRIYKGRG